MSYKTSERAATHEASAWGTLPTVEKSIANAKKGLRTLDGRKSANSRDWRKKLAVVLGVSELFIAKLIKGHPRSIKGTVGTGLSPAGPRTQAAQTALPCTTNISSRKGNRRSVHHVVPTDRETGIPTSAQG